MGEWRVELRDVLPLETSQIDRRAELITKLMKILFFAVAALLLFWLGTSQAQIEPEMIMTVGSTEFIDGAMIPAEYTCDGKNTSPPLAIDRLPEKAKSVVLIVVDRDAPGGNFIHWTIWNIDPKDTQFLAGTPPRGTVEGTNDFGKTGYSGPCPPSGVHRYYFTAYALSEPLDVPEGAMAAAVRAAMKGKVLKEAILIGKYAHQGDELN